MTPLRTAGHDGCLGCCSSVRWTDRPPPSSRPLSSSRVRLRVGRRAVEIQQTDTSSGELTSLERRADSGASSASAAKEGVKEKSKG